jgi:aryl-alcohol dehydrogenase-like predicted oxidoreductase
VDTAATYLQGKSELAVGKALKGRRDKVFVATKNNYKGKSADEWQEYTGNCTAIRSRQSQCHPCAIWYEQLFPGMGLERYARERYKRMEKN